MRRLTTFLFCLPMLAQACAPERDDYGRVKRSKKVLSLFRATVPCAATSEVGKRCPCYVVDHMVPLACCGLDDVSNMQWQTQADAKAKDKWERKTCGVAD